MTRRERLEARADKRRDWAESRDRKSAAGFARAHTIADGIPMGQPVLVGHHSERRHRRDLARIDSGMRAGCESADMAQYHRAKADGIEHQLSRSIFCDDPDAIEALEAKAAALDAQAERENAINKAWRKHKANPAALRAAWSALGVSAALATSLETNAREFSWLERRGPCDSTHARANARRLRGRVKTIGARQEQTEKATAAGGVLIQETGGGFGRVTFDQKPAGQVLEDLRAAGFFWSGGSWCGHLEALPECVKALLAEEVQPCMSTPTP